MPLKNQQVTPLQVTKLLKKLTMTQLNKTSKSSVS